MPFSSPLSRRNASVLYNLKLSQLFSSFLNLFYRHSAPSVCESFTSIDFVTGLARSALWREHLEYYLGGNSSQRFSATGICRDCTMSRPYCCDLATSVLKEIFLWTLNLQHFITSYILCSVCGQISDVHIHEITPIYMSSGSACSVSDILSKLICWLLSQYYTYMEDTTHCHRARGHVLPLKSPFQDSMKDAWKKRLIAR